MKRVFLPLLLCMALFLTGCPSTFSYDSYMPENNAHIMNLTGSDMRLIFVYEGSTNEEVRVAETLIVKRADRVFSVGGIDAEAALRSSNVTFIYLAAQEGSTLYGATGNGLTVFPQTITITRSQLDEYLSKRAPVIMADIKELLTETPAADEGEARYMVAYPGLIKVMSKQTYREQFRSGK